MCIQSHLAIPDGQRSMRFWSRKDFVSRPFPIEDQDWKIGNRGRLNHQFERDSASKWIQWNRDRKIARLRDEYTATTLPLKTPKSTEDHTESNFVGSFRTLFRWPKSPSTALLMSMQYSELLRVLEVHQNDLSDWDDDDVFSPDVFMNAALWTMTHEDGSRDGNADIVPDLSKYIHDNRRWVNWLYANNGVKNPRDCIHYLDLN